MAVFVGHQDIGPESKQQPDDAQEALLGGDHQRGPAVVAAKAVDVRRSILEQAQRSFDETGRGGGVERGGGGHDL